jgi:hypothetical protein
MKRGSFGCFDVERSSESGALDREFRFRKRLKMENARMQKRTSILKIFSASSVDSLAIAEGAITCIVFGSGEGSNGGEITFWVAGWYGARGVVRQSQKLEAPGKDISRGMMF